MKKDIKKQQNFPDKPTIKYVKRANAWVKTTWKDGKQTQEWSTNQPK